MRPYYSKNYSMSRRGLALSQWAALVGVMFVLAAMLFPVFVPPPHRSAMGVVRDGAGKPLAGVTLRFRDPQRRQIALFTTDAHGGFIWRDLGTMRTRGLSADGYGVTRYRHSTGNGGVYDFSPLVMHRIIAHDAAGRLIPGLALLVVLDPITTATPEISLTTDEDGMAFLGSFPAGARFQIGGASVSPARTYAVVTQIALLPGETLYTVLTGRTATLRGTALRANGAPARGASVIAYPKTTRSIPMALALLGRKGAIKSTG